MQEKYLFEYAVIRVVPKVEREEFINVGVILFCKQPAFLGVRYHLDPPRMLALCATVDTAEARSQLMAFQEICAGKTEGGPIALLDPASRFRWLTATRSTVVQTSKVHPGLSSNAAETLEKLYAALVC